MASEWLNWDRDEPMPPLIGVEREGMRWFAHECAWGDLDESEGATFDMYLHRDAARAWQAFREWCDGSADDWQRECVTAYDRGYEDGYGDLDGRIRG